MADIIASRGLGQTGRASSHASIPERVLCALAVWRQRRNLAELPSYLREDLGLTEDQIRRESRRPIWDVPQFWRL
ncbi:MAG: DUF1127 domain-containing protein [Roseicyclus sp.]